MLVKRYALVLLLLGRRNDKDGCKKECQGRYRQHYDLCELAVSLLMRLADSAGDLREDPRVDQADAEFGSTSNKKE